MCCVSHWLGGMFETKYCTHTHPPTTATARETTVPVPLVQPFSSPSEPFSDRHMLNACSSTSSYTRYTHGLWPCVNTKKEEGNVMSMMVMKTAVASIQLYAIQTKSNKVEQLRSKVIIYVFFLLAKNLIELNLQKGALNIGNYLQQPPDLTCSFSSCSGW